MGSPLYMSPEQMRVDADVDARADIWALGVILYELLTGRVPFEGESVPELCLKVVQDPLVPPKALRDEVSEGLSAVVCKCLEKDAAMRFMNVADLAAALEPYSASSQGASERIAGTLNVPSRPPMVSISATGSNPRVRTGGTAWGNTQAVIARKRRMPFIAGGAAIAAVAVTLVVVSLTRHPPADTTQAASVVPPATTTVTPTATAPVTATPSVTVTVTATATATASAPPTATAWSARPPRGAARRRATSHGSFQGTPRGYCAAEELRVKREA